MAAMHVLYKFAYCSFLGASSSLNLGWKNLVFRELIPLSFLCLFPLVFLFLINLFPSLPSALFPFHSPILSLFFLSFL